MHKQIYVNLPVKDLQRTMDFFSALDFSFEPKFTDEKAACLIIGENIYAMLLLETFFQTFTEKQICNARQNTEVIVCISCASRAEVDDLVAKAAAAGGTIPREPQDYGFMYSHGFEDLDGHLWELIAMEPEA
jgi:hypothetical protein